MIVCQFFSNLTPNGRNFVVKAKKGIRRQLLLVVLLPIILLGIIIDCVGIALISELYSDNIYHQLKVSTDVLLSGMDLMESGDYSFTDGVLKKGNANIIGSEMFYSIKEKDDIDSTVFWGDTRVLTTLEDDTGRYLVSTKADPVIAENVLENGSDFYIKDIIINQKHYIGYYRPLLNSGSSVVGMIFAGKEKNSFYHEIFRILLWFTLFSVAAIAAAGYVCLRYCYKLENDIDLLGGFLGNIEDGNLDSDLDENLKKRNDEIGEIGKQVSKMRDELKRLIEVDPLTLLNNRRSGMKKLEKLHASCSDYTIVMCDIDFFKKINDNFGHSAGDEVLTAVSEMMLESVEGCGFANRWGGEEFLLVYTLPFEKALEKTEKLKETVQSRRFSFSGKETSVTMTFGVKENSFGDSIEEHIRIADKRLYYGKRNGRNCVISEDHEQ